jgi:hypothetical protein
MGASSRVFGVFELEALQNSALMADAPFLPAPSVDGMSALGAIADARLKELVGRHP